MPMEISVGEVARKIKEKEKFILLDIREDWEREICKIQGDLHIKMNEILAKMDEISRDKEIIVYCHSGNRSMHVARYMAAHGFDAKSMEGGIDEWAHVIDKSMRTY